MIHVIATITLVPETADRFVELFKANIPTVRAEDGCIAYELTRDVDTGIPIQVGPRDNVVTVVEAWESLDHLHAHLDTPHMKQYHADTDGMTAGASLQVLEPV